MRKQVLTLCLLAAFSVTAAAENIVIVQGSYLSNGTNYEFESAGKKQKSAGSFTTWGGTATGYFGLGGDVGILAGLGVHLPTWVHVTEPEDYDSPIGNGGLVFAGDLGAGWKLDLPDSPLSFILGAGVHLVSVTLYPPEDSEAKDTGHAVFGIGAQALPLFEVGPGAWVTAGLKAAYHFMLVDREPELPDGTDYTGGLDFAVALGWGFRL